MGKFRIGREWVLKEKKEREREMLETWRWVLLVFGICILGWSPSSINAATDPNDGQCLTQLFFSLFPFCCFFELIPVCLYSHELILGTSALFLLLYFSPFVLNTRHSTCIVDLTFFSILEMVLQLLIGFRFVLILLILSYLFLVWSSFCKWKGNIRGTVYMQSLVWY